MDTLTQTPNEQSSGLRAYFGKIYGKMALGVIITTLVALFMAFTQTGISLFNTILSSTIISYGFLAIQLALLFGIQWGINKLSEKSALWLFFLYSALNGITLSVIFYAYAGTLILSTFVGAIAIFIALATLGKRMKYDMSGWRTFLFTAMWGIFITSIVNIFLASSGLDWILTIGSMIVFSALTIYDAQFYKNLYLQSNPDTDIQKIIIIGALHMYVNFIMIFVNLLRIIGGRD